MRRAMFLSQDGVVLCATLRALDELGILSPSLEDDRSLADLSSELTDGGFGALRIALQSLASTGWLTDLPTLDPKSTILRWTESGRLAMGYRDHYVALGELLAQFASTADDAWTRPWTADQIDRFIELAQTACDRWRLDPSLPADIAALIRAHLDGALIVPMMLWLHETNRLAKGGPEFPQNKLGDQTAQLLAMLGWTGNDGSWTQSGRQAHDFALNFGGVATYLPLLARLPEFYRGELTVDPNPDNASGEWHVHRELNLRISGTAHRRYFGDSDDIVVELFDREPIHTQPRFIADMGCGDGSWLIHLHRLISGQTRRGKLLRDDPLLMVGVDLDKGALEQAQHNLNAAGIPALLIQGDVTDPDRLRDDLTEHGLAIEDGLHVRSFIDHERSYLGGDPAAPAPGWSHGVYIDGDGAPLSGEAVERDLVAHMRRWKQHVGKHGMIVLEAHCVAPRIAARQLGALHSVAFDAHQAYSKQYPVDHPAFIRCCQLAGLQPLGHCERRYPSNRPFVSISLNRLIATEAESPLPALNPAAPRRDGWRPEPDTDLEDGLALHEILFSDGDVRYPAAWGSGPTGFVVAGALAAIEARLERAGAGDTIRVLDYGAGTGTAAIELLKACRDRDLEDRLARLGCDFELHLVDLPSSWFAQGYELLRNCEWTRFHSLRDPDGGFRTVLDAIGGVRVDAAMANMVFHLIPPRARDRAVDGLADALAPEGQLSWSAPDLGPPGPYAVLLHDPNRALRQRWLELLDQGLSPEAAPGDAQGALSPELHEAIRRALESFDAEALRAAQHRAERRILPRPLVAEVAAALERRFIGEIELRAYEMRSEEIVRGLLVPSNQAEYLPEIPDRELREQVIRELMTGHVLPHLQEGPAGTGLGLNLHWTLGRFSKHR